MGALIFDPRWSVANVDEFLREYMARRGIDIPADWDSMGETAVMAVTAEDESLRFSALKELNAFTKVKPRPQDMFAQPAGQVKPLHIGLSSVEDMAYEAEWEEIEREADEEFGGDYEESTVDE